MDKRTKAYKQWKQNQKKASEGLGDTVAKVTKATGVELNLFLEKIAVVMNVNKS